MRIHLAANWEGYPDARRLQTRLGATGHEVVWWGPPELDEGDDYPLHAIEAGTAVVTDEDDGLAAAAIVVGGDGVGEVVAANKVNGARAVAALSVEFIRRARHHADANVLVLPAALLPGPAQDDLVDCFLQTGFLGHLDDARRLLNIAEFENSGTVEGWAVDT